MKKKVTETHGMTYVPRKQIDFLDDDGCAVADPIHILYYGDTVSLVQDGKEIDVPIDYLQSFFSAIKASAQQAKDLTGS